MTELPEGWVFDRLGDVAEVRLGRQRSPKRATGDRMRPYLRAANVTWQGLALEDVKEMDFTEAESVIYELRPGDLLLSEASGSPGEVGKPAQYNGEIDGCCFQNTLIRVRLPDGLTPDFYEHFFREQALNGRFAAGSRGVGIHHLGAAGLSDPDIAARSWWWLSVRDAGRVVVRLGGCRVRVACGGASKLGLCGDAGCRRGSPVRFRRRPGVLGRG